MSRIWTIVGILALALAITPRFVPVSPTDPSEPLMSQTIADQRDRAEQDKQLHLLVTKLLKIVQSRHQNAQINKPATRL